MTDKQLNVLKNNLSDESINKLIVKGNTYISKFIELIIRTNGVVLKVDRDVKDVLTPIEIKAMEEKVNKNIHLYSKITDEYATIDSAYDILGYTYFRMEQHWFKGESRSRSHNHFFVDRNGDKIKIGQYDVLIDLDIYSIQDLFDRLLKRREEK